MLSRKTAWTADPDKTAKTTFLAGSTIQVNRISPASKLQRNRKHRLLIKHRRLQHLLTNPLPQPVHRRADRRCPLPAVLRVALHQAVTLRIHTLRSRLQRRVISTTNMLNTRQCLPIAGTHTQPGTPLAP